MKDVRFDSHGATLSGWHLAAGEGTGRPCVVMAHGFGCTRDGGLLPFAERFAAAGLDVLLFDYRGFGPSGGTPRQDVNHRRHRQDYVAAVAFARTLPGVDPERIALWGTSYSGGHVVAVAAQDPRIAAVVSQGAAMDGFAILRPRGGPPAPGARARNAALVRAAVRDVGRSLVRRTPLTVPVFAEPGRLALISTPGGEQALAPILGPTFRNELCARGLLRIPFNRPVRSAADVACPMLLVVAEQDEVAPAASVHEVARLAPRAEVVSYDCRHFAVYEGEVFDDSVRRQVGFLVEHLRP
ncbi:alpha/beta hydrolase [soil metagenome]